MVPKTQSLSRFLLYILERLSSAEESRLAAEFTDLSARELQIIEVVCAAQASGVDNRSSAIAAALGITAGTLTSSVSQLVEKEYLTRQLDEDDRRARRICPTEKGWQANTLHTLFYQEITGNFLNTLPPGDVDAFSRVLEYAEIFFRKKSIP